MAIDRIFIDLEDKKYYDRLKTVSFFQDKMNKDLFLLALVFGFKNNFKKELKTKEGYIRKEYLKDDDLGLIYGIIMFSENEDILIQEDKVFKIAEEYAHGGISLLINKIESEPFGSFEKGLEEELVEIYNNSQTEITN